MESSLLKAEDGQALAYLNLPPHPALCPQPSPGQDRRLSEASSAASVTRAPQSPRSVTVAPSPKTQGQETEDIPALGTNSCEMCHEVFKSKNVRVLQCGHKFHKGCFKQCLKGQSTCPACLDRDLLSEE